MRVLIAASLAMASATAFASEDTITLDNKYACDKECQYELSATDMELEAQILDEPKSKLDHALLKFRKTVDEREGK